MSKKYATFSSNGKLIHLLIEGTHDIPQAAIELEEDQWQEILQAPDVIWSRSDSGVISKQAAPVDVPRIIADTRFRYEIGGINVDDVSIDTSRDSQALITGVALSAMLDPAYVCTFKAENGLFKLNAEQVIRMATALRAHVQACFDREAVLLAALAEGSYTDTMLGEGWPEKKAL